MRTRRGEETSHVFFPLFFECMDLDFINRKYK